MGLQTVIVIAHRLSTIRDADCILVMQDHKIVERGTHSELLKIEDGVYQKLIERQLEGISPDRIKESPMKAVEDDTMEIPEHMEIPSERPKK